MSGNEAYVDGEYLYQDFLYDDYGSDTDGKGAEPLSEMTGDVTYPSDFGRYGNNAADLVEFRIAPTPVDVAYRFTLNTLLVADTTIIAVAFDTDRNTATGFSTLPRDPGATFPGTDEVLTVWGTGGEYSRLTATGVVTTPVIVTVDLEANQITAVVPRSVSDPHGTWRTTLATGLHDSASGGWLKPTITASATQGGGAGPLDPLPSGIYNLAFRFDEAVLSSDVPPDAGQAVAIRNHAPTTYAHDIDFDALDSHANSTTVPASGTTVRMFASRLHVGEGRDLNSFPGYLGQLQPYSLYVPTTYVPGTKAPFLLNLHSLSEHYWQYNGTNMTQQIGEQRGSLVATSLSRGDDGWYEHEAEYDVFEMWNDVASHFTLDPDRMAISGYSMGGYATYRLGTLYPDLFAKAFSQVGPPGEGIWIPPAPPTGSYRGDDFGTTLQTADATLTNLWLENARNLPYLNLAASTDELVPLVGPRAQNLGAPEYGIQGFDQLGYRFRFLVFAPCDHLALALVDNYPMAADFLGDAKVDRNPPHVTFAYVPGADDTTLGLVHDHAYWVSGVRVADVSSGSTAKGVVDAISHGFGLGDPSSTAGNGAGVVAPLSYAEVNRSWGDPPAIPVENILDLALTNLSSVRIDVARASLHPGRTLVIHSTSDADSTLAMDGSFPSSATVTEDDAPLAGAVVDRDGVQIPVSAGAHTYTIASSGGCDVGPRSDCRRSVKTGAARLSIASGAVPGQARLAWKWLAGEATTATDFGEPTASTSYALCVYDGNGQALSQAVLPSNDDCASGTCWRSGSRGLTFASATGEPSGISDARLMAGDDGKASIAIDGHGALLQLPPLPASNLPLVVQLQSNDDPCWESDFASATRNDAGHLKAKGN
ncbi:MAG TPA: prolyl oligopeptidase family serine peptidase [Candidatus Binatia bacterium]